MKENNRSIFLNEDVLAKIRKIKKKYGFSYQEIFTSAVNWYFDEHIEKMKYRFFDFEFDFTDSPKGEDNFWVDYGSLEIKNLLEYEARMTFRHIKVLISSIITEYIHYGPNEINYPTLKTDYKVARNQLEKMRVYISYEKARWGAMNFRISHETAERLAEIGNRHNRNIPGETVKAIDFFFKKRKPITSTFFGDIGDLTQLDKDNVGQIEDARLTRKECMKEKKYKAINIGPYMLPVHYRALKCFLHDLRERGLKIKLSLLMECIIKDYVIFVDMFLDGYFDDEGSEYIHENEY